MNDTHTIECELNKNQSLASDFSCCTTHCTTPSLHVSRMRHDLVAAVYSISQTLRAAICPCRRNIRRKEGCGRGPLEVLRCTWEYPCKASKRTNRAFACPDDSIVKVDTGALDIVIDIIISMKESVKQ